MSRSTWRSRALGWLGMLLLPLVWLGSAAADEPVQFNRDVRPLLSDRCFACHGPDAGSREADLRLDVREEATADRGGYHAVLPGKPEESELVLRINAEEEFLRMPPPDFGKPLSEAEREVLARWIAQGARWEDHWSLTPLTRPRVPEGDDLWARNAVDRFVLDRLRSESLRPAEEADRRTLIRRLYFDLTGLPPEPEAVEAFVSDESPGAYEALVDRLLGSPHYGERMAMYWLDLVRYADTLGYHGDQQRSVSPYRDYVIDAFNRNLPFDQFTIENLAGDLLPDATLPQKVASTYNRLNRASAEGGVQPKEYRAKYAADRVRTTASVWLGSTLGCAECHDHKFDPFTAKDFYSFAAFFADIQEQGIVSNANHIETLPVPTSEQQQELERLDGAIAKVSARLEARSDQRREQFAAWQRALLEEGGPWKPLLPTTATSQQGATLEIQPDGTIVARGKNPAKDEYQLEFEWPAELSDVSALRLDVVAHDELPGRGPGRAGNGNFVLQQFRVNVEGREVPWQSATATHAQSGFAIEHLVKGNSKGWAILPRTGTSSHAVFVAGQPLVDRSGEQAAEAEPVTVTVTLKQHHGDRHTLGCFRLHAALGPGARTVDDIVPAEILAILSTPPEQRTEGQRERLWQRFRDHAPVLEPLRAELAMLKQRKETLQNKVVTTLASSAGEPRVTRVLPRGNWMDDSGEIVQPAVPHFLPQPEAAPRRLNRLDLARWIVAPENPLTARTMANRLWMLFFGQGLSRSVDDLGSQGQWPTHPELLDWLAVQLRDKGWDIKHLVRLMVTSSTYRQSSRPREQLQQLDPYNELLARQLRWRIEAEFVRDNALAVSGLLVAKVGGPSVKPYQPAGYWAQLNFPKRTYQHDVGPKQYRRGLYTHWQRTFLHPSLLAFDAPVREECTAQRPRSNTPLQALVLLNDPTYVEAARVLAARALEHQADGPPARLDWMFQQCLQRSPTPSERRELLALLERNRGIYEQHPAEASQLLDVGLASVDDQLDPVTVASWTSVARALLNLHETIVRY